MLRVTAQFRWEKWRLRSCARPAALLWARLRDWVPRQRPISHSTILSGYMRIHRGVTYVRFRRYASVLLAVEPLSWRLVSVATTLE